MNDATAQQLAQAIQALATATAAPPAPPAAIPPPSIPNHIFPYKGNALDLFSLTGTSLFQKGSEALASKFTGKVEDLHLFLADLKDHSKTCRWNSTTHSIISLVISGTTYNLLDDYGKPNSNKINPNVHRLPRKNPPPNHHQRTKIRRREKGAPICTQGR